MRSAPMQQPADAVSLAGLSERQWPALEPLAAGASCMTAAREAGVTDRTLRSWRVLPEFCLAQRRLRSERWGVTPEQIFGSLEQTEAILVACMQDGSASGVRVRAASKVLDYARKIHDEDTEARLLDL